MNILNEQRQIGNRDAVVADMRRHNIRGERDHCLGHFILVRHDEIILSVGLSETMPVGYGQWLVLPQGKSANIRWRHRRSSGKANVSASNLFPFAPR